MVAANVMSLRVENLELTHEEAEALAAEALAAAHCRLVLIDASPARRATTAALARLILLRRDLLRAGRDLRLLGLAGQALALYEVHRLERILPRAQHAPRAAPSATPA